ncbi:MAG: flavodoxin domain-containing protein [Verrucomicrobiota bacterium]
MINIVFATETGTAEGLAGDASDKLGQNGLENRIVDLSETSLDEISEMETFVAIVSTWGDGEPPSDSEDLFQELRESSLDLSKMKFSVLSLGDTSYDLFCQFGKDLDAELDKRGARRILPRVDCDIDYDEPFDEWLDTLIQVLKNEVHTEAAGV